MRVIIIENKIERSLEKEVRDIIIIRFRVTGLLVSSGLGACTANTICGVINIQHLHLAV